MGLFCCKWCFDGFFDTEWFNLWSIIETWTPQCVPTEQTWQTIIQNHLDEPGYELCLKSRLCWETIFNEFIQFCPNKKKNKICCQKCPRTFFFICNIKSVAWVHLYKRNLSKLLKMRENMPSIQHFLQQAIFDIIEKQWTKNIYCWQYILIYIY